MEATSATPSPTAKLRRWPIGLLVGFITAIAGAFAIAPVADWVMAQHHVSTMEGGRACAVVGIWMPLMFMAGGVIGFVVPLLVRRSGFVGYLLPQIIALAAAGLIIGAAAGIGYATAEHPPLVDGRSLALDIEVRVPTKGRSIDDLKAAEFSTALVVSASDRSYSDMRWSDAVVADDFITARAWSFLRSRNADREITAGVQDENRQMFHVLLPASPQPSDAWSEWTPPYRCLDGNKPPPDDHYLVRYRVRFSQEYEPTPSPTATPESDSSPADETATAEESASPPSSE